MSVSSSAHKIDYPHRPESRLEEAIGLAEAIGLDVRANRIFRLANIRSATLLGPGKVAEIGALATAHDAELVIVDHVVTPVQQRNLEREWNAKVLDRTGLILEIFGQRAMTREGRLQVELARLTYQKGRLVRAWTHLERQRGGGGFVGGPGEAQIELDKRMINERISAIRRDLEKVARTRDLHRSGRKKVPYQTVALVGYTNAGKSTLFNALTGANVFAKEQVFATLDPTMRELRLGGGRRVIISDTVGFISDLPTMLIAAFRATLEEVVTADLILHVRDMTHTETQAQARDVEKVLSELGVDIESEMSRIIEVWNKIDRLPADMAEATASAASCNSRKPVLTSATTGEGLPNLLHSIDARLGHQDRIVDVSVPAGDGRLLHWLHENSEIIERAADGGGTTRCKVRIAADKTSALLKMLQRSGVDAAEMGAGAEERMVSGAGRSNF